MKYIKGHVNLEVLIYKKMLKLLHRNIEYSKVKKKKTMVLVINTFL